MVDYDALPPGRIVPFAMLAGPDNFRSKRINTDKHGFRFTCSGESVYKVENIEDIAPVSIIVGGSTVFGVGSTSDARTIPSLLSGRTNSPWLNFGVRGGTAFQEYIHITRFIHRAKNVNAVVIFGGINDTYINLLHSTSSEFDRRFEEQNSILGFYRWERQALSSLLAMLYRTSPERIVSLPLAKILSFPFSGVARRKEIMYAPMSIEKRLERLADVAYRMLLLYAALSKQFGFKLAFVLQPFLEWTGKKLTIDESNVMAYLCEMQEGSSWLTTYELMKSVKMYHAVAEIYRLAALKAGVQWADSNCLFTQEQTYFVDHVHLNDEGCAVAVESIINQLK
jgi:lysophospholipase L1-like esterase